jgi:hypothetical protein
MSQSRKNVPSVPTPQLSSHAHPAKGTQDAAPNFWTLQMKKKKECATRPRPSLLLCRAGTLERNEVALAELVDVDNAVFGTLALVVVKLLGSARNFGGLEWGPPTFREGGSRG